MPEHAFYVSEEQEFVMISVKWFKLLTTVSVVALLGNAALASVITVTGGEPGQGFNLNPATVVYAVTSGNPGGSAQTVQGVTFLLSNPNVTIGIDAAGGNYTNSPGTVPPNGWPSTTANDIALKDIYSFNKWATPGFTITIAGLTPSTNYQVELLLGNTNIGGAHNDAVSFFSGPVVDTATMANIGYYNVQNTVTSDGSGQIVAHVTDAVQGAVMSGLVVTTVPEPGTLALLAFGSLAVMHRRRKNSK